MKFSRWSQGVLPKNLSRLLLSGLGSLAAPSGRAVRSAPGARAVARVAVEPTVDLIEHVGVRLFREQHDGFHG